MAIEYSVLFSSRSDPRHWEDWIVAGSPLQASESGHRDFVGQGVVCMLLPQSELGKELVREVFGIEVDMKVVCRLDKFELHDSAVDIFVNLVIRFLIEYAGDLLVLSNGEGAILERQTGAVYIDTKDNYWLSKWRSAFEELGISAIEGNLKSL